MRPRRGKRLNLQLHFGAGRNRMRPTSTCAIAVILFASTLALGSQQAPADDDPIRVLVSRLDLEKYKATIKGLTQFGDRRQGTDRNRAAVDWIDQQLRSYGCTTERIRYSWEPPPPNANAGR